MPPTRSPNQPWSHSLTIDILISVLRLSIFHPFVASLAPLSLCAGGYPLYSPIVRKSIYWAIVVCVFAALGPLNEWIAYGKSRKVDQEEEVMLVTGGGGGLGRCIAETYGRGGGSVVVFDVKNEKGGEEEGDEEDGVRYFECDIGNPKMVEEVWGRVCKEVGVPTIVINCAGIVHGKGGLQLTSDEVARSFAVNTISHYMLNKLFVSSAIKAPNGGTIVTISSVLARLGAAQLSVYTATKAALVAYHNSLTAELEPYPNIKTILVATGQLSTDMFSDLDVGPLAHFFGPTVEVSDLAIKILRMVTEGRGGVIAEPAYARWICVLDVLPVGVQRLVRRIAGVDSAMKAFSKTR